MVLLLWCMWSAASHRLSPKAPAGTTDCVLGDAGRVAVGQLRCCTATPTPTPAAVLATSSSASTCIEADSCILGAVV